MRHFILFLFVFGVMAVLFVRIRYGGGDEYRDLTSEPLLEASQLGTVLSYPEPIGNVLVTDDGRLFFTVHPESRPEGNKLLEWVDGAAVPYPNGSAQPQLFNTVLGIAADKQNRLWTLDHGRQGFAEPRLLAFDLSNGAIVHDHKFNPEIAPTGSFLQDLRISPDGRYVIIADGSILGKNPAFVVYDIAAQKSRRVLQKHDSVQAKNLVINTSSRDLSYFGGIFVLKSGVSGVEIDNDEHWLYFAALSHDGLYRVPLKTLLDATISDEMLAASVERFSDKPLSDGMAFDRDGHLLVTDVEHNAVFVISDHASPKTLIRSAQLRWPSSIDLGPDGYMYLSDSAFPDLLLQSKAHIKSRGPYSIFRFRYDSEAAAQWSSK